MSYYGYIVVKVEDYRTKDGETGPAPTGNGKGFEIGDMEDPVSTEILDKFVDAVRHVRDVTKKGDLDERWRNATARMDSEKMRKALEILEA